MANSKEYDAKIELFRTETAILEGIMMNVINDHMARHGGMHVPSMLATVHSTLARVLASIVLTKTDFEDFKAMEKMGLGILESTGPRLMQLCREVLAENGVQDARLH